MFICSVEYSIYALRALLNALSPVIGAEKDKFEGKAIPRDWAKDIPDEQIEAWSEKGKELRDEVERIVQDTCANEYARLLRKRLGLRKHSQDQNQLFQPLLDIMETHHLDFHITLRNLVDFDPKWDVMASEPDQPIQAFISRLLKATPTSERLSREEAESQWRKWLNVYAERINGELSEGLWGESEKAFVVRKEEMRLANPRFVLRQWLLEEVIKKVERDSTSGKRVLAKVMHVSENSLIFGAGIYQNFRWLAIRLSRGVQKAAKSWRKSSVKRRKRRGGIAELGRRKCWDSSAAVRVRERLLIVQVYVYFICFKSLFFFFINGE